MKMKWIDDFAQTLNDHIFKEKNYEIRKNETTFYIYFKNCHFHVFYDPKKGVIFGSSFKSTTEKRKYYRFLIDFLKENKIDTFVYKHKWLKDRSKFDVICTGEKSHSIYRLLENILYITPVEQEGVTFRLTSIPKHHFILEFDFENGLIEPKHDHTRSFQAITYPTIKTREDAKAFGIFVNTSRDTLTKSFDLLMRGFISLEPNFGNGLFSKIGNEYIRFRVFLKEQNGEFCYVSSINNDEVKNSDPDIFIKKTHQLIDAFVKRKRLELLFD